MNLRKAKEEKVSDVGYKRTRKGGKGCWSFMTQHEGGIKLKANRSGGLEESRSKRIKELGGSLQGLSSGRKTQKALLPQSC